MIDLANETVITLAEAAKRLPTRPHIASVYRHAQRGVRGIRLETIQVAGTLCTSVEAIQRWCERLTAARNGETLHVLTSRQRERAVAQAERELSEVGI
jgi:hypothetical protein